MDFLQGPRKQSVIKRGPTVHDFSFGQILRRRNTVPAEISCLNDYCQELVLVVLSLLYYLEIGRSHRQKVIEAKKYEPNRQNNG